MKKTIIFIFLAIFVIACSVKTFEPTEDSLQRMQQKVPGITIERAEQGYQLYKEKCASCHRLYSPDRYNSGQWDRILKTMFVKAKTSNADQQAFIIDYLHASAK